MSDRRKLLGTGRSAGQVDTKGTSSLCFTDGRALRHMSFGDWL